MKIRPLHDRLIVKRLEEERKTASGIVIPDSAAEKPEQGEVKAVGKGKVQADGKSRRRRTARYARRRHHGHHRIAHISKPGESTWLQKTLGFTTRPAPSW